MQYLVLIFPEREDVVNACYAARIVSNVCRPVMDYTIDGADIIDLKNKTYYIEIR
jgi:hypothetical protein